MALSFVCNGLTPVVVGRAVDDAIATQNLARLVLWLLVLALLFAFSIAVNWIARYMLVRSQQLVGHDLRTMVTDRIQDPRGLAGRERTAGGLLSIASSDTQRVGEVVMMTVFPVAEVVSVIYGATVMFFIDPRLGIAVIIGGPVLVGIALRVSRPLQRRSMQRQQAIAQAAATSTDVVQGLRILKGLGAITTVRRRYEKVSSIAYEKTIRANAAEARLNGVTEATGAVFVAAIGVSAGHLALNGSMSIGELITVVGLTQFLIGPMTMLGRNLASRWASAEASGRRIRDVLGAGFERTSTADERAIDALPAGLTVLHAGEGHHELLELLEAMPRHRVIVAPHAADLFEGTVADNVFPDPAIAAAAITVASCSDIPGGAGKQVGEGGGMLSGGQRQRVALARAIAFNPEVLVLQDPTTAVDSVTEQNIAEQVTDFRGERVTIVVSDAPA
nr:ABC transporter ATP-binding protein [Corynebacterium pacaense]